MEHSTINEFARNQGYEKAEYLCEWNGFKCYEPIVSEGEMSCIGLPLLILEDSDGKIRMSTPEEATKQIDETE